MIDVFWVERRAAAGERNRGARETEKNSSLTRQTCILGARGRDQELEGKRPGKDVTPHFLSGGSRRLCTCEKRHSDASPTPSRCFTSPSPHSGFPQALSPARSIAPQEHLTAGTVNYTVLLFSRLPSQVSIVYYSPQGQLNRQHRTPLFSIPLLSAIVLNESTLSTRLKNILAITSI